MRILVTGSRHLGTPREQETLARALLSQNVSVLPGQVTLVHGDAPGADTMAAAVACSLGWQVEPHPALWKEEGYPQAGPMRNQRMVDAGADICVAFPRPDSRGTIDCMRRAREAGIPVVNGWDYAP